MFEKVFTSSPTPISGESVSRSIRSIGTWAIKRWKTWDDPDDDGME